MRKKRNYKKICKNSIEIFKMNSLEYLKISLLNFSFVMIYIIRKMLLLLESHLNYFKDFSNAFFKYLTLYSTTIKDMRNHFSLEKETKAITDIKI